MFFIKPLLIFISLSLLAEFYFRSFMNYKSHLIVGASSYVTLMTLEPSYNLFLEHNLTYHLPLMPLAALGCCLGGSLLPDIDHPSSKLGQWFPFISKPLSKLFGHRGITHSLLIVFCMMWYLFHGKHSIAINNPQITYLSVAAIVGYLSHLVADMLTPAGLPLFYPIKKRINLAYIGKPVTQGIVSLILFAASVWLYIHHA